MLTVPTVERLVLQAGISLDLLNLQDNSTRSHKAKDDPWKQVTLEY